MDNAPSRLCLMPLADLPVGAVKRYASPGRRALAVFNVAGEIFVTDDTCTHGAASLSDEGALFGHVVECSWHNGGFDVRTGEACAMPCTDPLRSWPVQIVDGQVCIHEGDING